MQSRLDASYAIVRQTGVPNGWELHQLSDLVRIVSGGTPDRNDTASWRDGGIPWITPTDLTANDGKYISTGAEHISVVGHASCNARVAPAGSIVFSTRGTVGNLAITAVPLTTNQSCEVLVPRSQEICSEFLYYLLSFGMFAFHRLAGGTTFGAITRREIGMVHLALPSQSEQTVIARLLDRVDSMAHQIGLAIAEAKNLKHSLVQDFFYSGLGVTAYADRPTQELPSNWKLLRMEALLTADPKNGVSPKATSKPPGIPTFSIAAIRDGRVNIKNEDHLKYTEISPKVADKFRLFKGDVLIVRGNANPDLVGKAGAVTDFPRDCIYPDITMRVCFRQHGDWTVSPEFAVLAWNHPVVHNQILRRAKTSNGTLKINSRDVRQTFVPVPPPKQQQQIVDVVAAVDAKIDALREKLKALAQLKNALMHDLLTGTVRIPPALFTA